MKDYMNDLYKSICIGSELINKTAMQTKTFEKIVLTLTQHYSHVTLPALVMSIIKWYFIFIELFYALILIAVLNILEEDKDD